MATGSNQRARRPARRAALGAGLGLLGIALVAFPYVTSSSYFIDLAILTLLSVVQAEAWNLLGGYAGQISFGHATFFGIGAYTSTVLLLRYGLSVWIGMVLGGLLAAVMAWPLGWLTFRLRGPYFSLATLAVGEVTRVVAFNWYQLTGGGDGLNILAFLGGYRTFYWVALALMAATVAAVTAVVRSRAGTYLKAIRADEDGAEAVGIDATRLKILALVLSAFFVGMAGSFFASYRLYINPELVLHVSVSLQMIFVTVAGGIGTIAGPVLGSVLLVPISEYFRSLSPMANLLIYGLFIVVVMLFLPGGLVQLLERIGSRGASAVRGRIGAGGTEADGAARLRRQEGT